MSMRKKSLPYLIVLLVLLSLACGLGAGVNPMLLTLTPLSAAVRGTATAQNANVGGPNDQLNTAIAKATSQSANIYATETARASLNSAAKLATATVIAPVVAELPRYGVDPGQGYVAWMHKPVTIDLNGYQQNGFANDYPQITAKNFVLAADINWYTYNSLSACGFMFRSDGNTNKPSQYLVGITRYATGYLAFTATYKGEMSNVQTFYPSQEDKSFTWFNNATNRLTVVARGNKIDTYTNGVLIGTVDTTQPPPDTLPAPPAYTIPKNLTPEQLQQYQDQADQNQQAAAMVQAQLADAKKNYALYKPVYTDGLLGFIAISQSGETKCTFSNAWLFILNN